MPDDTSYYAVIFTSQRTADDAAGYAQMAEQMTQLAAQQSGFLGMESVRDESGLGITVSYWQDLASIRAWRNFAEHRAAQVLGKGRWYQNFHLRISRVEQETHFEREA